MDKPYTVEHLLVNWNECFPNHTLSAEDLKKPHALIAALFQVFDRLGIDQDAILAPPPENERNENIYMYWDLQPVINTSRVVNHLIPVMPQYTLTITQLLQPTVSTSHSMLLLLYNLMLFRQQCMDDIAPYEQELFSRTDKVNTLNNKKNSLLELLNKQLAEKAERSGRLKNIDNDIKQYEEELKQEEEALQRDKQIKEANQKELRQIHSVLEQKKGVRDALVAEVDKERTLRVYDAEDIKAQVKKAKQNIQYEEEKLHMLQEKLNLKENSLKNLQSIKPNLDTANNLLYDITMLAESLRDCENEDAESKEDELEKLVLELGELEAQLGEQRAAAAHAAGKRRHAARARQQGLAAEHSTLREAEEKEKNWTEKSKKAAQKVMEIQELTDQYAKRKAVDINELANIKENFIKVLKAIDEAVLKKMEEALQRFEAKKPNRHG